MRLRALIEYSAEHSPGFSVQSGYETCALVFADLGGGDGAREGRRIDHRSRRGLLAASVALSQPTSHPDPACSGAATPPAATASVGAARNHAHPGGRQT